MRGSRVGWAVIAAFLLAPAGPARGDDAPAAKEAEAHRVADLVARLRSADLDVRRQAVAEAKREQAPAVTAGLVRLLGDPDEKVRIGVVEALGARADAAGRREGASHLAARLPRLGRNEQREERLAALRALHDLAEPATLKALAEGTGPDAEPEELALRLRAVANLPCDEAVEWLIRFRSASGRGARAYRVRMAREAWVYATGQAKASNDPDAWRAWWGERRATWDHEAALARRKAEGGGPKVRDGDAEGR